MSTNEKKSSVRGPYASEGVASIKAIIGVLTMFLLIGLPLCLASFIMGLVAIVKNRHQAEGWRGRGLAIAAVVISGLALGIGIPFWIIVFPIAMSA